MNPAIAFGQALRELRTQFNISQERLSQESGLDRSYISLLERGLRQPSLMTIFHIAAALNISPVELVSRVEVRLNENNED